VKRRLFVAVALDEAARSACAAAAMRLRDEGFAARWTPPEGYHLTVAFLGAVDAARSAEVEDAMHGAAADLAPLDVPLDALGAFPNPRRARIVWAGPARPVEAFAHACGAVRHRFGALGFAFDEHTDAHVTLARSDGGSPLPSVPPPRAVQHAAALTLFESVTEPAGTRYVAFAAAPFGQALVPQLSGNAERR
jgi:2'-5' RNA ligase